MGNKISNTEKTAKFKEFSNAYLLHAGTAIVSAA